MALSPAHEVAHGVVLKKNSSTGEAELCQTGPLCVCLVARLFRSSSSSSSLLLQRRNKGHKILNIKIISHLTLLKPEITYMSTLVTFIIY
jgi:hypothetical protein